MRRRRKERDFDYSGLTGMSIFQKALEDEGNEEQIQTKTMKNGSINYVAMIEKDKEQEFTLEDLDTMLKDDDVDDYDKHYDESKMKRQMMYKKKEGEEKRAKYFDKIQKAAEVRKREQWIVGERIAAKQMKREGKQFSDAPKFMTESYRKKLEENKEFEKLQKLKEEQDKNSAKSKNGMSALYRGLFNRNMNMGEEKSKEKKPAKMVLNFKAKDEIEKIQEEVTTERKELNKNSIRYKMPLVKPKRERSRSQEKRERQKKEQENKESKMQVVVKSKKKSLSREEKLRLARERLKKRKQASSQNLNS